MQEVLSTVGDKQQIHQQNFTVFFKNLLMDSLLAAIVSSTYLNIDI